MRKITYITLLVVALGSALGLAACGGSSGTTTAATTEAGGVKTATIQVAGGEAVGGEQTLTVKKGDHVRITVTVDAPQEVHLHGYDIEKELEPGTPGVWDFTANIDGIYEMESHLNNPPGVLLKLVVEP